MHCGPHVHQLIIATQSNHINKMHLEWKSRSDYTTCKACSGIQRYLLPWITTSDKMQCIAGGQWWWWIWTWWYSKICVHMLIGGCPMVERMHAYASIYLLWSSRVHGRHITIILFESSKKTIACSFFLLLVSVGVILTRAIFPRIVSRLISKNIMLVRFFPIACLGLWTLLFLHFSTLSLWDHKYFDCD